MNAQHPPESRLHDYLDGLLTAPERRELELHLDACEACRSELAAFRDIAAGLAALPRAIAPERDLRPGIHAGIRWSPAPARALTRLRRMARRPLAELRWPLAAAALLLLALGASLALILERRQAPSAATGLDPAVAASAAEFRAMDGRYAAAADELLAELEALENVLPPETLAIVRENLRAIDAALREARHALADDPGDPRLARLIMAAHEKKLDLLRRAAALSAET